MPLKKKRGSRTLEEVVSGRWPFAFLRFSSLISRQLNFSPAPNYSPYFQKRLLLLVEFFSPQQQLFYCSSLLEMGRKRREPKDDKDAKELERLRKNQAACRQRKLDKCDEYKTVSSFLNVNLYGTTTGHRQFGEKYQSEVPRGRCVYPKGMYSS